jgi:hypothetical protein
MTFQNFKTTMDTSESTFSGVTEAILFGTLRFSKDCIKRVYFPFIDQYAIRESRMCSEIVTCH